MRLVRVVVSVIVPAIVLLAACERHAEPDAEGRFDLYLAGVPSSVLNLDAVRLDTIRMDRSSGVANVGGMVSGRTHGIAFFGDTLYVVDAALDAVLVADTTLKYHRVLGGPGVGPGEYTDPVDIVSVGDSLLVVHEFGERIQVVTWSARSVGVLPQRPHGSSNIDADARRIFAPSGVASDNIISAYQAAPPFEKVAEFLPALIPVGKQPTAFNSYRVAAGSPDGSVVAAYAAIPLLVVFDRSLVPVAQVELVGEAVADFGATPLVEVAQSDAIPVAGFFQTLAVECKNVIVFGHRNTAYFVDLSEENPTLLLKAVFSYDGESVLHFHDVSIHAGRVYLASGHEDSIYSGRLPTTAACGE